MSKWKAIIQLKCPHCGDGNLFLNRSLFSWRGMVDMPDRCTKCGQDFRVEEGFYSGAPYISYLFVFLIGVPAMILQIFVFRLSIEWGGGITVGLLMVLQPIMMRYARAIWLSLFVK